MKAKNVKLLVPSYSFLARAFLVIVGCFAVWWGTVGFLDFWQDASTERIAARVLNGDSFKSEVMAGQIPAIRRIEDESYCRPAALRSAVVIKLRMMEVSASQSYKNEAQRQSLLSLIRTSLTCTPTDSFLWLALYSADGAANHFSTDDPKYLRMSYRLAPNDGWIALKRNRVAFESFHQLPSDLAETVINEFVQLVRNNLFVPAADIFMGPAWPERDLILSRLKWIPNDQFNVFADALHQRGYDLDAPKVGSPDWLPVIRR
jgi:hypothetical protein